MLTRDVRRSTSGDESGDRRCVHDRTATAHDQLLKFVLQTQPDVIHVAVDHSFRDSLFELEALISWLGILVVVLVIYYR